MRDLKLVLYFTLLYFTLLNMDAGIYSMIGRTGHMHDDHKVTFTRWHIVSRSVLDFMNVCKL